MNSHWANEKLNELDGFITFMLFLPLALILIGLVFLLKNVGLISVAVWGVVWPSLLMLLGVYLVVKLWVYARIVRKTLKTIATIENKILKPFK